MSTPGGRLRPGFALVLHTHLPFVLNHGRWPHGSDWLSEAAVECYLPLLDVARRLVARGISPRWSMNISPVLAEQLASPAFAKELDFFVSTRLRYVEDNRGYFRRTGQDELTALTYYWEAQLVRGTTLLREVGGDLLGAFGALQDGGHLEIMTCAATHGYLPLLSRDESIHLQLRTAVETHRRHFGRRPRGIWLPECAYRPRYEWRRPLSTSGVRGGVRPGLEELLARHGLEFFVVDAHLVRGGAPLAAYHDFFPALATLRRERGSIPRAGRRPRPSSPYRPYRVASRGGTGSAVAFVRDPRTTLQVWSRAQGYPGEPAYLEFHKKHFPGGFRYWRVTGSGVDLGDKQLYDPRAAAERVEGHADHFARLLRETLETADGVDADPGIVVSPYDAELFGHWWYEGPAWLEAVALRLASDGVRAVTLAEVVDAGIPEEATAIQEGSWGEGGDHRVWLNRETEWTWNRLYDAEGALIMHLRAAAVADEPLRRRLLTQACREGLLLQASDWQFLITTQAARDYAERRFASHYAAFKHLVELLDRLQAGGTLTRDEADGLARLEEQDFVFPDLDPVWAVGEPP